jgi:hypothetical protein
MQIFNNRRSLSSKAPARRNACPGLDGLEPRCVPSVVTIGSATQANYQTVSISYDVAASNVTGLTVNVYRSTVPQLGGSNQVLVGMVPLSGSQVTEGEHDGVPLMLGDRAPGVDALAIDPAHPYVIAATTGPDGVSTSASYRTITVGLVTHGFNATDTPPEWIYQIASALSSFRYDDVIPFNWAHASHVLEPNQAVQSGVMAAQMIESFITGTNSQGQPNVPPGAVVDLQLIGHSRGSVVITQAAQTLGDDLGQIPQAKGGYWELTYLDPHPSHGTNVAPFSATSQTLIDAANALQNEYQDPYPLTVPAQVALAQVYYEQTPVSMIVSDAEEGQLDPLGITYPTGIQAAPGSMTRFETQNLTTAGMTHSGVWQWYQANVVPTLATANPFVTGPVDAPVVGNGESLDAYEGLPTPERVAYFNDLDPNLGSGDFTATINWGDPSAPSQGLVIGTPSTGYFAFGLHDYEATGTYSYTVTIQHTGGSMTAVSGSVNVTSLFATAPPLLGQAPGSSAPQSNAPVVDSSFAAAAVRINGRVVRVYAMASADGTARFLARTRTGGPSLAQFIGKANLKVLRKVLPPGDSLSGPFGSVAGAIATDGTAAVAVAPSQGVARAYAGAVGALKLRARARFDARALAGSLAQMISDLDSEGLGNLDVTTKNGAVVTASLDTATINRLATQKTARLTNPASAGAADPSSFLAGVLPRLPASP